MNPIAFVLDLMTQPDKRKHALMCAAASVFGALMLTLIGTAALLAWRLVA